MSNPSKAKGTRFETAVTRYLNRRLDVGCVERLALAGADDRGDVGHIPSRCGEGMAECKSYAEVTPKQVETWRGQVVTERANGNWEWAALIVSNPKRGVAKATCHITLDQLCRVMGLPAPVEVGATRPPRETWVCLTLAELCECLGAERED